MKEKILAAIKAKFPSVNLSKKRLDAIAARIEAKIIDDETKIDATIDDFNSFTPLSDIAKEDDKMRNLEAKLKAPATKKEETGPAAEETIDPNMPEWMKPILEQNKVMLQKISALESEKTQGTVRSEATKLLKDVPVSYWGKRALPEKVEELEAFVTDVTTDYGLFTKELTDKGIDIAVLATPKSGEAVKTAAAATKEVAPEIKAFAEKQAKAAPVAATK